MVCCAILNLYDASNWLSVCNDHVIDDCKFYRFSSQDTCVRVLFTHTHIFGNKYSPTSNH